MYKDSIQIFTDRSKDLQTEDLQYVPWYQVGVNKFIQGSPR